MGVLIYATEGGARPPVRQDLVEGKDVLLEHLHLMFDLRQILGSAAGALLGALQLDQPRRGSVGRGNFDFVTPER